MKLEKFLAHRTARLVFLTIIWPAWRVRDLIYVAGDLMDEVADFGIRLNHWIMKLDD